MTPMEQANHRLVDPLWGLDAGIHEKMQISTATGSCRRIAAAHRKQRIGYQLGKADFRFRRKLPVAGSATNSGADISGRISVRWTGGRQRGASGRSTRQSSERIRGLFAPPAATFSTCV